MYCGYFRGWTNHSSGRAHGRRTIAYAETEDFRRWPIPETIVTTDVHDHPGADIYTNGYALWPDADAHLMFPAFFQREIDITQIQLLTSRDGVRWERHTREPLLGGGDPGTSGAPRRDWTAGFFAGAGVISVRPDESSIAVIPCVRTHNNEYSRPENLQQAALPEPDQPVPRLRWPDRAGDLAQGRLRLPRSRRGRLLRHDPVRLRGRTPEDQRLDQVRRRHIGRARRLDRRVPLVRGDRHRQELRRLRRDHDRRRRPHGDMERRVRPIGVGGQDGPPAVQAEARPALRHLVRVAAPKDSSSASAITQQTVVQRRTACHPHRPSWVRDASAWLRRPS